MSSSSCYNPSKSIFFNSKILRINECDESLLVFIIPTMPEEIRKLLLDDLSSLFPGRLIEMDTKDEGVDNFFPTLHLSWYNRYCTKV